MAIKEKSEAEWQAEWDARTLADGEQIKSDTKRHTAAKKAAVGVAKDMEKAAKEQADRVKAVKKIATAKVPKPAKKRAAPAKRGLARGKRSK